MKRPIKTYYICLNKATNVIALCSTKVAIAAFMHISTTTLNRRLKGHLLYSDDEWIVWCEVKLHKARVGFALK